MGTIIIHVHNLRATTIRLTTVSKLRGKSSRFSHESRYHGNSDERGRKNRPNTCCTRLVPAYVLLQVFLARSVTTGESTKFSPTFRFTGFPTTRLFVGWIVQVPRIVVSRSTITIVIRTASPVLLPNRDARNF